MDQLLDSKQAEYEIMLRNKEQQLQAMKKDYQLMVEKQQKMVK